MFSNEKHEHYMPLELQRYILQHLIYSTHPRMWNKFMQVNATWLDEICRLVYKDSAYFYKYWNILTRRVSNRRLTIGSLDKFAKQYARYAECTTVCTKRMKRAVCSFYSPWMKCISTNCQSKPEHWIGNYLQTGILEKFCLSSLRMLDTSDSRAAVKRGLIQLAAIFNRYKRPLVIWFNILINQLEMFAAIPPSLLNKVTALSLQNLSVQPDGYYMFTKKKNRGFEKVWSSQMVRYDHQVYHKRILSRTFEIFEKVGYITT